MRISPWKHCAGLLTGNNLQPESIEGLRDSWIIYRMKARIERGFMVKDEIIRKNVRIVNTLDPSNPDSSLAMVRTLYSEYLRMNPDGS